MVKKLQVKPVLYIHQAAAPIVHRNISTTADGRRLLNKSNPIDLPFVPAPEHEQYTPLQEPVENEPYSFDDNYIPTDHGNLENISGVRVNVTVRAVRRENSVRPFF